MRAKTSIRCPGYAEAQHRRMAVGGEKQHSGERLCQTCSARNASGCCGHRPADAFDRMRSSRFPLSADSGNRAMQKTERQNPESNTDEQDQRQRFEQQAALAVVQGAQLMNPGQGEPR
jgi:hypothetical protein